MKTKVDIDSLLIYDNNKELCTQDVYHIGTKLRNRILKASILLPFGDQIISVSHLLFLLNEIPIEIHGLVKSNICPKDRQNYNSFLKMVCTRTRNALDEYIVDSQATVMFLKICDQITSAFTNFSLKPLERIYLMFHSIYVLRIWRNFIKCSKEYSLTKNFITLNAYSCVEINGQTLIDLIIKFREENTPELF